MNLSGLYHLYSFIAPIVTSPPSRHPQRRPIAQRATGFQLPKPPAGFLSRDDLPHDASQHHRWQPREVAHVPDCSSECVISYAGLFKDVDSLPRRTLQDLPVSQLEGNGVLQALAHVFRDEGIESLSQLQLALFNELAYGSNALFHSATSTGKTFSMLMYAVLRYYYNIPSAFLCKRKFSEVLSRLKRGEFNQSALFEQKESTVPERVFVLCPTKELAIQSARQLIAFAGGDEDCVRLIIDDQAFLPNDIDRRHIFIVGSANQLNVYLLTRDKTYLRGIMQRTSMVILDEVDRLLKVTNQYAPEHKKDIYRRHPTASFQICQALLSVSPNKVQLVGASASISRNHIRFINNLIQSYRTVKCPLAIIRNQDEKTSTNRYVSVPSAVSHHFAVSPSDSLGSKVGRLSSLLKQSGENNRVICFVSSKHSLLSFKHYIDRYGLQCKVLHHEFGIRDNVSKRFSGEMQKGLYDHRESSEALEKFNELKGALDSNGGSAEGCLYAASMDSARGLHFPLLDTVYMIGVPRNVNEYIHISGRVGRCGRPGRCVTVDTILNVKKALAWQKGINCTISPLSEGDATALAEFRGYEHGSSGESDTSDSEL